jgi:type IV pilus assembly protein PilQ
MRSTRSTEAKREHWLKGAAIAVVASLLLLNVGHALAQTANSIENVTVSKGSSGRTIVRFTLKAPLPNPPAGFAINNPPRIALDFLDTGSALPNNQRAVDDPALRSLQFVQAGNRTRVVFNLNTPPNGEVRGAWVLPGGEKCAWLAHNVPMLSRASARHGPARPAARVARYRLPRGRNGEDGSSSTCVGYDDRHRHPPAGQDADRRLHQDPLPRNLERRLDVGDFATPVMTIDTFEQAGNTRMVIGRRPVGAFGLPD